MKPEDGGGLSTTVSTDINGATSIRRLPSFNLSMDAWKFLSQILDKLRACSYLLAPGQNACRFCQSKSTTLATAMAATTFDDRKANVQTANFDGRLNDTSSSSTLAFPPVKSKKILC